MFGGLSNNIIQLRFVQFSQLDKIGHFKLMFTIDFSCVNIGTRNIARFVGIYSGNLGENKLLYAMKIFALILSVLSFSSFAEVNLVKVDKSENKMYLLE